MEIKLIAMDLDGTLTQHKSHMNAANRKTLEALAKQYKLLMVGAGQVERIFRQMEDFPIDIIGNYGLQYGEYCSETGGIKIIRDIKCSCDSENIERKVTELRERFGYTEFYGDNVEYHPSGCVTIPLLGTAAAKEKKLAFDPDRTKRRKIYRDVCETFPEYSVFVGGSSSFDMAPKPYNKYYALDSYCSEKGYLHGEVVYIGDDYGMGGNDESVYQSDFNYLKIDNFEDFPEIVGSLLRYSHSSI